MSGMYSMKGGSEPENERKRSWNRYDLHLASTEVSNIHFNRAMILIIDNYDSFTYNLVHIIAAHTSRSSVVRNDAISLEEAEQMDPSHILFSPGPGRPADAGISEAVFGRR